MKITAWAREISKGISTCGRGQNVSLRPSRIARFHLVPDYCFAVNPRRGLTPCSAGSLTVGWLAEMDHHQQRRTVRDGSITSKRSRSHGKQSVQFNCKVNLKQRINHFLLRWTAVAAATGNDVGFGCTTQCKGNFQPVEKITHLIPKFLFDVS